MTRPKCIVIQLEMFRYNTAEDHCTGFCIAEWQRFLPDLRGFIVPELQRGFIGLTIRKLPGAQYRNYQEYFFAHQLRFSNTLLRPATLALTTLFPRFVSTRIMALPLYSCTRLEPSAVP